MGVFTVEYETNVLPNIESAVENALANEVERAALNAIEESATKLIYQAYSPKFWSRRGLESIDAGYEFEASGKSLTITSIAPLQNLYGDSHSEDLGDIIAEGWDNFNMPSARPWMDEGIEEHFDEIENALANGMKRQGY